MSTTLTNKNVIFVAGLGGIGLDTSKELVKRDLKNLVILDRIDNPAAIAELKAINPKVTVSFYPYDVTVPIAETTKLLKTIFAKLKTVDILINGAGILDDHEIERTIAVNYTGLVNTTTAIMDFWDKRKGGPGGIICNIGSVTGFNAIYQVPVYSGTKAAVVNFTSSLAKLAPITGVTAYTVNPGITRTTLVHKFNSWLDVEPQVAEKLLAHPTQPTLACAENFVKAIELNQNGAIWKLDLGTLEPIQSRRKRERMFDLTGKHVCYVADCGGIALETSKILMTKNIAKLAILQSVENPQAIAQLQSIKPSTQIFFWTYDVTMAREEMKQYFDEVMVQMDYIDVLINGATLCDENNIAATINTNLTGMMNTDPLYYSQNGVAVIAVCCGPTRVFVDRELKAFLEYGQSFADRLRRAPCQPTSVCGQNIVSAIERSENGQIWIADKGGLELVKLHWYWHMADQFVHYMQSNDEEDQD
ncbi:hypothetical protein M5D96_003968 [Drosophila gunungcola]|uniref:Alcohol dehydrogenase n=2 Tax=Drosophila gunungcola TaxID=103775 RepID=A0A9Q0BS68_9MUSC|nr:hypothetical protein M5D96_003968 [Drosophila gunungcola]